MANFEGLIRQALASQDATDPATRQRIYQSSRNALARMLEKTGNTGDEAVRVQFGRLEQSISNIEAEYAPAVEQAPAQLAPTVSDPVPAPEPARAPVPETPAPSPSPVPGNEIANPHAVPAQEAPIAQPDPVAAPSPAPEPSVGLPRDYEPAPLFPPVDQPPIAPSTPEAVVPQDQAPAQTAPLHSQAPSEMPAPQPAAMQSPEPVFEPAAPTELQPSTPPRDAAAPDTTNAYGSPADPRMPKHPEPYLGDTLQEQPVISGAQQATADEIAADRPTPPSYRRKNPILRRIWPIVIAIAVVMVILWILYALFASRPAETGAGADARVGEATQAENGATLITLLQPTDLSALVTAGRGSAALVTEQQQQMLRLKSIRQGGSTENNAEPILLELERGVLRQIEGKAVTVEFLAKSGGTGPAQFAIQCDIGGDSVCGRKRFRVGLQPERILFSLDLRDGFSAEERAFLAINTDITDAADTTGDGDEIDIIHVRLRLNDNADS